MVILLNVIALKGHICIDVGKHDGSEQIIDIICGANNVKADIRVVCALAYTALPNGKIIIPTTIFGYETNGMLCSYNELNLKQKEPGIIVLTTDGTIDTFYDNGKDENRKVENWKGGITNYHLGEYFWPAYTNMQDLFSNTKISK